ncbi:MAG: PP2C family protein-serine/threonine phosphatase [Pseudomonadota bacterium]
MILSLPLPRRLHTRIVLVVVGVLLATVSGFEIDRRLRADFADNRRNHEIAQQLIGTWQVWWGETMERWQTAVSLLEQADPADAQPGARAYVQMIASLGEGIVIADATRPQVRQRLLDKLDEEDSQQDFWQGIIELPDQQLVIALVAQTRHGVIALYAPLAPHLVDLARNQTFDLTVVVPAGTSASSAPHLWQMLLTHAPFSKSHFMTQAAERDYLVIVEPIEGGTLLLTLDETTNLHTNRRIGFLSYVLLIFVLIVLIALLDWLVGRFLSPLRRILAMLTRLDRTSNESAHTKGDDLAGLTHFLRSFQRTRKHLSATDAARRRAEQELELARQIQAHFIPHQFPAFPERDDFDLHAVMQPAKTVGGDFYDFQLLDEGRLFFMIGDVSDKGFASAFFMAITRTAMNMALAGGKSQPLAQMMSQVNQYLTANNPSQMFVTLVAGILDTNTGIIELCDAGHEPPILLDVSMPPTFINKQGGLAMGFDSDYIYRSWTVRLQSGQGLFFYTDGITEARAANEAMFGTDRLIESVTKASDIHDPRALIAHVNDSLLAFTTSANDVADDATMLVVTYGSLGMRRGANQPNQTDAQ